ncbi:MAG TPA: MFS transporter [Chitinophagaceae bacterium]|nr:MFS transporter [Chitinophagaceae bacterium]
MAFEQTVSVRANRVAVSVFFFIAGLSFASWASRIPDVKAKLHLNEGTLGTVLLALPAGLMASLPVSGYLVNRFGSKRVVTIGALAYPFILIFLGLVNATWQLAGVLFLYGLLCNLLNISVNTQAVGVEVRYGRSIMASFHGVWSLAGFTGAAIGTLFISLGVPPFYHFCIVCAGIFITVFIVQRYALEKDIGGETKQPGFALPDSAILKLGIIAFGSMVSEGTMFDWSGVYFQKVVQPPKELVSAGFVCFMGMMATGRFAGDFLITKFGVKRMLQMSGIVISTGLLTAVIFPYLYTALVGFMLVGFGVSSVVPMVYGLAGKSKNMSPGVALAAVSSIGFIGFLLGPPVIGFVAQAVSLRLSFTIIAVLGLGTTFMSSAVKIDF